MPTLKELLLGMEIVDVIEGTSSFALVLKKKDSEERKKLVVDESGGPGLDANWYNYPAVSLDGKEIWHG